VKQKANQRASGSRRAPPKRLLPQLDELPIGIGDWIPTGQSREDLATRLVETGICRNENAPVFVDVAVDAADAFVTSKGMLKGAESRELVKEYLINLQTILAELISGAEGLRAAVNWLDHENDKRPPRRAQAMLRELEPMFFPTSSELGLPSFYLEASDRHGEQDGSWAEVDAAICTIQAWARPREETLARALQDFSRAGQRDREADHALAKRCKVDWKWLKDKHDARGPIERYAEAQLSFIQDNGVETPQLEAFIKLLTRE
jgi:hypothetical protein